MYPGDGEAGGHDGSGWAKGPSRAASESEVADSVRYPLAVLRAAAVVPLSAVLMSACGSSSPQATATPTPRAAAVLTAANNSYTPSSTTEYTLTWDAGPECSAYNILLFLSDGMHHYLIQNVVHRNTRAGSGGDAAHVHLNTPPAGSGFGYIFAIRPAPSEAQGPQCAGWRIELYPVSATPAPR